MTEVPWGSQMLRVLHVNQAELGIEVDVSTGDQVNTYCDTASLSAVAALFDACSADGGVAILDRHSPAGADLVIFRGTDTPLNFPTYRRLRSALHRAGKLQHVTRQVRPELPTDRCDDRWRQNNQITVRTLDHVVLLGGTSYGLRMCALSCMNLATSDRTDHRHWDDWWLGTSKTVEFIMRNTDRD